VAKDPKRCGAKTRSGGTCKGLAMENGRCRMHGGATPSGIASPAYRTGRYSRHLPARLAARYQEATSDPELLELRAEVALVDARLADLLARVDSGESGQLWANLYAARGALLEARRRNDALGQAVALNTIIDLVGRGHADYAAWAEIGQTVEQRRRLVESERKRLVEAQQMITVEKAMLLIGAIGGIIKSHVTDRAQLTAISQAIGSLVTIEASE
jgi:hypothetical protein